MTASDLDWKAIMKGLHAYSSIGIHCKSSFQGSLRGRSEIPDREYNRTEEH